MTRIFVGNLAFTTTEQALHELFGQFGTVQSVKIVTDRDTGQSRGFAFIEMPNSEAPRAIDALNGKRADGRPLRVNEAQERGARGAPRRRP